MYRLTSILAVADATASGQQAVEKALKLSEWFGARVDLITADPGLVSGLATRCIEHRLAAVTLTRLDGTASLHELIRQRVHERLPDLVIKPACGAHPLRRWTLNDNDRQLAADCPAPLLLTTARPWTGDLRMAATVDVGNADSARFARAILRCAAFLAMGSHAWLDVLYSEAEERDERVRMERAVKLSQLMREFHLGSERLQMFGGPPERTLPRLVEARHYDLLVLGAVTHRDVTDWAESLSSRLVDACGGDVLLVKPGERRLPNICPVDRLLREQHAHLAEQLV